MYHVEDPLPILQSTSAEPSFISASREFVRLFSNLLELNVIPGPPGRDQADYLMMTVTDVALASGALSSVPFRCECKRVCSISELQTILLPMLEQKPNVHE